MPLTAPAHGLQSRADALREQPCSALAAPATRWGRRPEHLEAVDTESLYLAVPRRGHVLSTVAEYFGNPIREAVAALSTSLARRPQADIARGLRPLQVSNRDIAVYRSDPEGTAWLIVSMWISSVATKALPTSASLVEAERWFFGGDATDSLTALPSGQAIRSAEKSLRAQVDVSAHYELLPYILDPHGPGSRLSVRRDPATQTARSRKRAEGIFYTPADVAEYMAGACLDALSADTPPTVFDPACGTGVFLRAALRNLRRRHPEKDVFSLASECLFGADIDPWPLDATAFVLLADTWTAPARLDMAPVAMWRRLRLNLACIDTLRIDPAEDGSPVVERDQADRGRPSISRLFPALRHGPTVILGNPPYADLGARSDLAELSRTFQTIAVKPQPNAEIYLAFIEQMLRLAELKMCAGALVLPLSIACNVGPQFTAARKLIAETRGLWRFAFFDREPHALFGEDVKTRNAIILWSRASPDASSILATGPLRKWRGNSRAAMFKGIRFTIVDGNVRAGIPKIEGECQAVALKVLSARWNRLEQAVRGVGRCALASSPNADDRTVFVGPTAYNFLNVFLRPPRALLHNNPNLSEHPLHAIRCASRQDAFAVFAVLSSHLAYWWWHAHGDGFHVSNRFIAGFPFGVEALTGPCGAVLSESGDELWSMIGTSPIISVNRGRSSLAFTPNGHDGMRRRIDQTLANLAGLETAFVDELQKFTARTVSATLRDHIITETDDKEVV